MAYVKMVFFSLMQVDLAHKIKEIAFLFNYQEVSQIDISSIFVFLKLFLKIQSIKAVPKTAL